MSLGLRLALLVLLAAVPVFLVQVWRQIELREEGEKRVVESVQSLADQIAARQNRFVEAARFLLTAISRLEDVRSGDPVRCSRELRQIHSPFAEITGIGLVRPDGLSYCSSTGRTEPIDLADRPYFQAALRTRTIQTSGYIVGRATGSGSFVFAMPVLDDDESVNSVIILAFRTEVLSRDLNDPPLPEDAFAALVDREGMIVARWPAPDEWVGRKFAGEWQQASPGSQRGVVGVTQAGEQAHTVAYAPMQPPVGLTVVAGQSLAPALRRLDAHFWLEVVFMALVFVAAALGAWLFGIHRIQRPVRGLMEDAQALSRGEFEPTSAPRAGIPELRLLATHFRRMAEALSTRQGELEEALRHKEMLIKEVNHRVKNSLQLVASLFALQRSRINDPELRRHFEEATRRVSTIARIHQRLYEDQHVDRVAFGSFLVELCDELAGAMASDEGPQLRCQTAECDLPTDKAIPLALIVNELVLNATKHAYSGGRVGTIRVDCRNEKGELMLTVADDGEPLPANFDPVSGHGLGMRVIRSLIKQLDGQLEVLPEPIGKSFLVRIPV